MEVEGDQELGLKTEERRDEPKKKGILKYLPFAFILILLSLGVYILAFPASSSEKSTTTAPTVSNDDRADEIIAEQEMLTEIHEIYSSSSSEAQRCDPNQNFPPQDTVDYKLIAADCGLDYDFEASPAKTQPMKVVLYGKFVFFDSKKFWLLGCVLGKECPYSPECSIERSKGFDNNVREADVVVIFQEEYHLIDHFPKHPTKKQYFVLYWREAFWNPVPINYQEKFDFEMGVHWQSGILNPSFQRSPSQMLAGFGHYGAKPIQEVIPFLRGRDRTNFAMSIISHCHAGSRRDEYISHLIHVLGNDKIHRYGKCGDRVLPSAPISNAIKVISKYKFYLSFENMIQDGYVTEKLYVVLAMPVLPVYYGHPNTPNITISPSFIKASDFPTPKALAKYLLYLDENPEIYDTYHEWRNSTSLFHPDFLHMMARKSPGYAETLPLRIERNHTKTRISRAASCCRLCDENYLKWAKESRYHFIEEPWDVPKIQRTFFDGK